ncbi:DNA-directed DNA polymerase eta rad30 [Linnemannia gamsii]|uniref:DNA polymerase eta n=1 Tax=Linnemannia gamsii TaxID=64522 RepID=A0ABQ7KFB3_9FUNG|nr:DNA-directed DNA polymerase eta rad30 [Linnemannia gamsii]
MATNTSATTTSTRVQVPAILKRRKCFLHIDLDCFFAQVEQIRLGLSADVPLVSQQWNAIIAVNYAARKSGITRLHHNVFDAKLLCPELVCAHVATLGPGDAQPDYYPSPSRYTHKVSLDPYRKASAKIFNVFRKFTAKHQKGGLDEVFMDVTDVVNQRIMDEYGADLSKWDRESAVLMDWKRDYSHAGAVFGMPRDGSGSGSAGAGTTAFQDDDEEDRVEGLDGIQDGQIEVEFETENGDLENDDNDGEVADEVVEAKHNSHDCEEEDGYKSEYEQGIDDDFDLNLNDLENDFESTWSQPSKPTESDTIQHEPVVQEQNRQPDEGAMEERSEEELQREKEERRERREYLQPFYGITDDTFEEQFWAEQQILKAAEYCNEIRQAVKDELGYTCSAGIANNRLLAKLGSGMNKPFQQTLILPKYIPDLLHDLKISKIRNLGGKFGKQVKTDYNIEMASELWPVPLRQLQERYGDQAGLELWQWCRGIDHIGIRKIKSKSMTSHKSFIPALNDMEEIQFWISSVCLELEARIHAEFDETERWPRTISLGFFGGPMAVKEMEGKDPKASIQVRHKGTRSMPLPSRFEYGGVEGMAKKMWGALLKLIKESETGRGRPVLPLILLTVTVSNFAGGHDSAMGDITKFFSKASAQPSTMPMTTQPNQIESGKEVLDEVKGKLELDDRIQRPVPVESKEMRVRRRFFQPIVKESEALPTSSMQRVGVNNELDQEAAITPSPSSATESTPLHPPLPPPAAQDEMLSAPTMLHCTQCPTPGQQIPIHEWEQHTDYHFALRVLEDDRKQGELERQQQRQQHQQQGQSTSTQSQSSSGSSKRSASSSSMAAGSGRGGAAGGKRKKVAAAQPLARFFKPGAN